MQLSSNSVQLKNMVKGGGVIFWNTPTKRMVFVIEEHGRVLAKKSLHKITSELFDKALNIKRVDAVVVNGESINKSEYLLDQVGGRDISSWDIIYIHDSKYPPVLLTGEDKEALVALLPDFNDSSAQAIYKVLTDAGAYEQFHKS